MAYPVIQSRTNAKIKDGCRLTASAKYRREQGLFTLEGLRLCADAAQSGCQVQTLFLTADAEEKGGERLKILLKNAQKIYTVTEEVAEKLSDTVSSQGVFAILQMLPETALAIQKGGKYVVLDTVQNPQNLGAIARTAEAFGVNGLIVGGGCDRYNPKALRASMGSLLRLPNRAGNRQNRADLCHRTRLYGRKHLCAGLFRRRGGDYRQRGQRRP